MIDFNNLFSRPFRNGVHHDDEYNPKVVEFGKWGEICYTDQRHKFLYVFHDDNDDNDGNENFAVFDTIEDARKFDNDLRNLEDTFYHFKDWGQLKNYERRRMHALRTIRQLVRVWGEFIIPSHFKYEYYRLLHRDNLDTMVDDNGYAESYKSIGLSPPSKDTTRHYVCELERYFIN